MKILILGGTGAMGVPLTQILARAGHDVYITSRKRQTSDSDNIHYIQGNAKDNSFLIEITQIRYDAIVDFMHYYLTEFAERMDILLTSTEQYLFLSSCRVFAPSQSPITEQSSRLLDVITDTKYLETDEYALSKARVENLLKNSRYKNYTIIRPYITYNTERLQLSIFEKEAWLYRALKKRSIVFCKDLAEKKTTLTHGYDVAKSMAKIIGNAAAFGETVNIVTDEAVTWLEILELYINVIEKLNGVRPKVIMLSDSAEIGRIVGNTYKLKYDRLSDRLFDNEKIRNFTSNEKSWFYKVNDGLQNSLTEFIKDGATFKSINWGLEAYFDKIAGERTPLKEIQMWKHKVKYLIYRYTPYMRLFMLRKKDLWW